MTTPKPKNPLRVAGLFCVLMSYNISFTTLYIKNKLCLYKYTGVDLCASSVREPNNCF